MSLTPSELVVLGLVIERPRHGYELDRTIAERGIRQWADVAFSSIYYVLGKLEQRGFVLAGATSGPRSRRIYSATAEGRAAASTAAGGMLGDAAAAFSPFVVGLANVDLVDPEQFRAQLRERARALTEQITAVEVARDTRHELPPAARLVFSYTLATLVAERDWLTALETGDEPS
ncbi:MAG: PadR family transcriptional regulator [Pseudonocardia sp.]|nr:PadR family transcriptional regulator [Pseudonocardia sp.]